MPYYAEWIQDSIAQMQAATALQNAHLQTSFLACRAEPCDPRIGLREARIAAAQTIADIDYLMAKLNDMPGHAPL